MRAAKSREMLTELTPLLLRALAATSDPDQAFLAFDRFLQGLPSGVQLFSMLKANPHFLSLIANILGTAPRLAQQMSARPRMIEAFLDPAFFGPLPTRAEIDDLLARSIPAEIALEETMDRARELGRELMFGVGSRILSETVSADEAGEAYSSIADALIALLHTAVTRDMEHKHGAIAGGASVIVALGKLGGREMTAGSDLDLMLIYDHIDEQSEGTRSLQTGHYYARLTQRLVSALSSATAEGTLYDVDMRLRPSGSKGPVAVSLRAFIDYQTDSAWTWEKLALTRARVASGDAALAQKVETAIRSTLIAERKNETALNDVISMRALMLREHKPQIPWDIKRAPGGLVEIEFIAQTLQLLHAAQIPAILSTNTAKALTQLREARLLPPQTATDLLAATALYQRLTQLLRLCTTAEFDPETSPPGLSALLARAAQIPDIRSVSAHLAETEAAVATHFTSLIGRPPKK